MPGESHGQMCLASHSPWGRKLDTTEELSTHEQNRASQVALVVKNLLASAGDARDVGSIPGLGRSPGVGNGNAL